MESALSVPCKRDTEDLLRRIDWDMMDKGKFVLLSAVSSLSVRFLLYPLILIKTRLQLQKQDHMYGGLSDAFVKIYRQEGIRGFYGGVGIGSLTVLSGFLYAPTYEIVRHLLSENNCHVRLKSILAGGCASIVGQTAVIPFEVVSQHLMVFSIAEKLNRRQHDAAPLGFTLKPASSRVELAANIVRQIYTQDGLRGFYRGYAASILTYAPGSAIWWGSYDFYQDTLMQFLPVYSSTLVVQTIAAAMGGFTTALIMNPFDTIRSRLQVQRLSSIFRTFSTLWTEEHLNMFTKGLSARLVYSAISSFAIVLGYETIKRVSVKEEYKNRVRW